MCIYIYFFVHSFIREIPCHTAPPPPEIYVCIVYVYIYIYIIYIYIERERDRERAHDLLCELGVRPADLLRRFIVWHSLWPNSYVIEPCFFRYDVFSAKVACSFHAKSAQIPARDINKTTIVPLPYKYPHDCAHHPTTKRHSGLKQRERNQCPIQGWSVAISMLVFRLVLVLVSVLLVVLVLVSVLDTPSPPTKICPITSPRVKLSGRLPIKLYGHENFHALELRVCLSQTL